jgi:hypothetical protein
MLQHRNMLLKKTGFITCQPPFCISIVFSSSASNVSTTFVALSLQKGYFLRQSFLHKGDEPIVPVPS